MKGELWLTQTFDRGIMSFRYFPMNYYGYFFDLRNFFVFLFGLAFSILILNTINTKNSKQVSTNQFMMTEVFKSEMLPTHKKFNKMNLDDVKFTEGHI